MNRDYANNYLEAPSSRDVRGDNCYFDNKKAGEMALIVSQQKCINCKNFRKLYNNPHEVIGFCFNGCALGDISENHYCYNFDKK